MVCNLHTVKRFSFDMKSSGSSDSWIPSESHHHSQDTGYWPHPKSLRMAPCLPLPLWFLQVLQMSSRWIHSECVLWCSPYSPWHSASESHPCSCRFGGFPVYCWVLFHCTNTSQFIHRLLDRHLEWFHRLAIMSKSF